MGVKWNKWVKPIYNSDKSLKREYIMWNGFMNRAGRAKSYKGVTISNTFKSYDYFYVWYNNQVGSHCVDENNRPFELDKDIVGNGLEYSEDNCVLVPRELNSYFKSFNKRNTSLPLGVSKESRKTMYRASLSIGGKHHHIGYFKTPEEASVAYKKERHNRINYLLNLYPLDKRVVDIMTIQIKSSAVGT